MVARAFKQADVKVGQTYLVKLHGKLTRVKILERVEAKAVKGLGYMGARRTYRKGGVHWRAVNLATGREVVIKSAAKLRREVSQQEVQQERDRRDERARNRAANKLTDREMWETPNGTEKNLSYWEYRELREVPYERSAATETEIAAM